MRRPPTWGLVATIKAPATEILNFAAHHIELGAHRLHIYLDEDNPAARAALKAHPKCRVTVTDAAYWKRRRGHRGRPGAHQPRQSFNATHCLNKRPQVDWLTHIDVDEFLWPERPLPQQLAALPPETFSARVRPIEALAPDPADPPSPGTTWFKACARLLGTRRDQTDQIYPEFGPHLDGGFVSHVAGKVFVRTDVEGASLRIHNALRDGTKDPAPVELHETALCHFHAPDWPRWLSAYRFRLARGSYREGLKPAPLSGPEGLNMNALFTRLEAQGGEAALARFFAEVCTATPALRSALSAHGLLRGLALDLDAKRARHFPDFA
jgi:hypothetical protein